MDYRFREDDHGDMITEASLLHLGSGFAAEGIIEQRTDVDVFKHSANGEVVYKVKGLEAGGKGLTWIYWLSFIQLMDNF